MAEPRGDVAGPRGDAAGLRSAAMWLGRAASWLDRTAMWLRRAELRFGRTELRFRRGAIAFVKNVFSYKECHTGSTATVAPQLAALRSHEVASVPLFSTSPHLMCYIALSRPVQTCEAVATQSTE